MEDLLLSPMKQGSFKPSLSGKSAPTGSPTIRRLHSGRTPRKGSNNGGDFHWFRSNRLLYWFLLITLWTYLGFYIQSRWAHDDDNKVEFLRFGGKLREEDVLRVKSVATENTRSVVAHTNIVHLGVNKRMDDVSLVKKEDTSSSRRRTREAVRSSRSNQIVVDAKDRNVTFGKIFGPFGSLEDRILPQKRTGTCDRKSDFKRLVSSRRFVLVLHELSMTGAPISMMELASELICCGATVSAVVLSRRGGLMQELTRRRIKVVEDKGEVSFRIAMKADLVIAGSAVCASWIDQYMDHHSAGGSQVAWWVMENRREYFDRAKPVLDRVKLLIFLSEVQSKQWLTWCEEEGVKLRSQPVIVPLSVNDELAFVAGVPSSLNTPTLTVEMMKEKREKLREAVRVELGLTEKDMLVMSLSSINPGKGQLHLLESAGLALEREREPERVNKSIAKEKISHRLRGSSLKMKAASPVLSATARRKLLVSGDDNISRKHDLKLLLGSVGSKSNKVAYVKEMLSFLSNNGNLSRSVLWTPATTRVASLYSAADVYVTNSQGIGETFGRVTIEAMAYGLPVLGTDAGGTKEIVEHNVTGLLHPVGKSGNKVLAQNLLFLLRNPSTRLRLGSKGREMVEKMYMKQDMYKRFVDVLVKCMRP